MTAVVAWITDFGTSDSYVAEMKLRAMRVVPDVSFVDVTHEIAPYDRLAAALCAERVVGEMPRGSALVVVVDPGVGTQRARAFGQRDGVWLVGPDNGVLPLRAGLDATWQCTVAPTAGVHTFDGREVFAPVATQLAAGRDPAEFGTPAALACACVLPHDAVIVHDGSCAWARGVVIARDRFGNAVTNIRLPAHVEEGAAVVEPERFAGRIRRAYGDVARGARVALVGSSGRVELAVREGASDVARGDTVTLTWK